MSAVLNRYGVSLNTFFEKEAEAKQFAKDQVHKTKTISLILLDYALHRIITGLHEGPLKKIYFLEKKNKEKS